MIKVQARGARRAEILIHEAIGADYFGDGLTSKRFISDLEKLGELDEILVRINSPGGAVWDGIAIYNALKGHKARVEVLVDGLAASIASVIAMSGDTIRMAEGSAMMIHDPWTIALGNAEEMREVADTLEKVAASMAEIYETRSGLSRDEVRAIMRAETWFNGAEAVEKGFADEAAGESESAAERAAAHREDWKKFAATCREQLAAMSPLQIAAAIKSALADATTQETDVSVKAPASVQPTDNPNTTTPAQTAQSAELERARREAAEKAVEAEAARRAEIRTAFGRYAEQYRALLDECLDDVKCSVDKAREKLLAKLGEQHQPLGPSSHVVPGRDSREAFLAGAEQALLVRAGVAKRETGNEFYGMTLCELGALALTRAGVSVRGLSRVQLASRILAAQTSSDFPQLMSNVAGKVLRAAYGNFPNTWNIWASAGSVSDFKIHPRIQLGAFNSLDTIPEGGEYTYGSLKEDYENAQAVTKGKAIALTRQMLVNDDLGAFNRRATLMGRAAARTVNSDAYAYLTSGASNNGPTTTDGGQFFNSTAPSATGSGHGNLASSGAAISVDTLSTARATMRKQKDKSLRETLNINPTVLLVPVAKEDHARTIVTSETKDGQSNSRVPNVIRNTFEVVSDPYLDSVSSTAWYVFANPADVAAFEVVFLDGVQEPFVDEMIDFDTDAMKFKVRLDYGVAPGDWRAAYKNPGA